MQQNDIMEHITYHASDCKEAVLSGDDDMTDGKTGWLFWPSEMAAGGGGFGTNSCTHHFFVNCSSHHLSKLRIRVNYLRKACVTLRKVA